MMRAYWSLVASLCWIGCSQDAGFTDLKAFEAPVEDTSAPPQEVAERQPGIVALDGTRGRRVGRQVGRRVGRRVSHPGVGGGGGGASTERRNRARRARWVWSLLVTEVQGAPKEQARILRILHAAPRYKRISKPPQDKDIQAAPR